MPNHEKELLKQQISQLAAQYGEEYFAKISSPDNLSQDEIDALLKKMQKEITNELPEKLRQEILKEPERAAAVFNEALISGLAQAYYKSEERNRASQAERLEDRLNTPVSSGNINKSKIGNWSTASLLYGETYESLNNLQTEYRPGSRRDPLPQSQNSLLRGISNTNVDSPKESANRLAYYSPNDDKIHVYRFSAPLDGEEKSWIVQYSKNNPAAKNCVVLHEAVHKRHANHEDVFSLNRSPAETAKFDRLTETAAHAVEYLAAANMYTNLKKQGVKIFEYATTENGIEKTVTMPLEDMLEMYPGLKEAIKTRAFSPNDSKAVREVVKAAAADFKDNREFVYDDQHAGNTFSTMFMQLNLSFSARLAQVLKDNDKETADAMLRDVYIGTNQTVDLTGCKDLLDTMTTEQANELVAEISENASEELGTEFNLPNKEEIMAINAYLEKKGITSDEEKDRYLEEQFQNIVNRSPDADEELKKILLQNNNTITYADGLTATYNKDGTIAVSDQNGAAVIAGGNGTQAPAQRAAENQTADGAAAPAPNAPSPARQKKNKPAQKSLSAAQILELRNRSR